MNRKNECGTESIVNATMALTLNSTPMSVPELYLFIGKLRLRYRNSTNFAECFEKLLGVFTDDSVGIFCEDFEGFLVAEYLNFDIVEC